MASAAGGRGSQRADPRAGQCGVRDLPGQAHAAQQAAPRT